MFLLNTIHHMDALSMMRQLEDNSIDAYITDLPYGTTACKWDVIIPFEPMWAEVKRTLKPKGVFVTTASQPFSSLLTISNLEMFKYEWIWHKSHDRITNFAMTHNMPGKVHEQVLVFSKGNFAPNSKLKMNYYPQGLIRIDQPTIIKDGGKNRPHRPNRSQKIFEYIQEFTNYPTDVITFNKNETLFHPTQKPITLCEYLIKTYTKPNDVVCDPCCGSGTTAIAARNLGRNFIACDTELDYVNIALDRLSQPHQPSLWGVENGQAQN